MAHKIQISRAWCNECLSECFFAFDTATGQSTHVGPDTSDLAHKGAELSAQGYTSSHHGGVYTYTLYKAAPLIPLPLDWQMAMEARETIDIDQEF